MIIAFNGVGKCWLYRGLRTVLSNIKPSFENMGPRVLLLFLEISRCTKVSVQHYVVCS